MKNFVSIDWLKKNIDKENLIILDVRYNHEDHDEGLRLYKEEHIEGASFVSLEDTLTGELGVHGGNHPLPNPEEFAKEMHRLGVNDYSTVVIYDNGDLAPAGRLWFLLKYIGKENVYILQRGFDKWKEDGGQVSKEIPQVDNEGDLSLKINEDMIVGMEFVKSAIDSHDTVIVDARAPEKYSGAEEAEEGVRVGHIPSAVNYPWGPLMEEGEINSLGKLEEYYGPLKTFDEVIVHCGSGVSATVGYILMDEVGIRSKLYPGSFSDWISYEDNEVVLGE